MMILVILLSIFNLYQQNNSIIIKNKNKNNSNLFNLIKDKDIILNYEIIDNNIISKIKIKKTVYKMLLDFYLSKMYIYNFDNKDINMENKDSKIKEHYTIVYKGNKYVYNNFLIISKKSRFYLKIIRQTNDQNIINKTYDGILGLGIGKVGINFIEYFNKKYIRFDKDNKIIISANKSIPTSNSKIVNITNSNKLKLSISGYQFNSSFNLDEINFSNKIFLVLDDLKLIFNKFFAKCTLENQAYIICPVDYYFPKIILLIDNVEVLFNSDILISEKISKNNKNYNILNFYISPVKKNILGLVLLKSFNLTIDYWLKKLTIEYGTDYKKYFYLGFFFIGFLVLALVIFLKKYKKTQGRIDDLINLS